MRSSLVAATCRALVLALSLGAAPYAPHAAAQTAPAAVPAPRPLPALGDAASDDLSVGAERRLGDRIMRELRRDPDVLDDPLLLDYVQGLFQPLVRAARQRGEVSADLDAHMAWEPFLVRDRSVNAFALPGGYVGVYLGLIAMTTTRDELASVLAHEMSHVTQRHIARSIASTRRSSMLGVAAMILGVLAASRSSIDGANALIVGGQAVAQQGQLNFSRDMEREADRVGFGVLGDAGFAPVGMAAMFERLQQASRLTDTQQFPYLRSHPLTSERIGEARARLGLAGGVSVLDVPGSGGDDARWLHAAMQGRARALMDLRAVALQRLATVNANDTGLAGMAASYTAAMAAIRLKDWRAADLALARALALAGNQPRTLHAVQLLQAEALLERGQAGQAAAFIGEHLASGSRPDRLLAARAAIAVADAPPAAAPRPLRAQAEELQGWVTDHPADATAWGLLAQLQQRLGLPLAAVRSQAEERLALGDVGGAIDRLRAGQRLAREGRDGQGRDSFDASVIESRLKALEIRRREEQMEERNG